VDYGLAVAVQVNNDVGMSRGALGGLLDSVAGDLARQHAAP
jgi:hypothetical protein